MAGHCDELEAAWVHPGDGSTGAMRWGDSVVAASSARSPEREGPNQDALLVMPAGEDGVLLAVADGCGGMPAGDRASRAAVRAMATSVGAAGDGDLVSAVLEGFDRANEAVTELRLGAGSTLTAVLIAGSIARVFHAGDSLGAVVGHRGALRFGTLAHSLTGFGVEAGLLSEAEAAGHEDSGVVLNVLGSREMFVHVGPPVHLRPMDSVLIASDGLTDNVGLDAVISACRVGTARAAVGALTELASRAMADPEVGHADDLSVVLYRPSRRRGD